MNSKIILIFTMSYLYAYEMYKLTIGIPKYQKIYILFILACNNKMNIPNRFKI